MNLKINLKVLNQLSIVYIAIPLFVFLLTWLKPYIAIIFSVLLMYAIYCGYFKNKKVSFKGFLNSNSVFITILLVSVFWCYFAGIGGFWNQSNDYHWRNAIFRDLINYSWPVYYNTIDVAMVYYMGFWLPAAIVAKLYLLVFSNISADPQFVSFFIGNEVVFLYSIIGMVLVFINLMVALKVKKISKVLLALLIFIIFSGLDIVGVLWPIFYEDTFSFKQLHLEWWSLFVGQYSSNTTILFWVFNQGIPAWLLTLMFYNNRKNVENYGLLGLLCFFCAPMPFLGLAIFLILYFIKDFILKCKKGELSDYLKKVFSVENIIAIAFLTPIVLLYFMSNATMSYDSNSFIATHVASRGRRDKIIYLYFFIMFSYFILLEVLLYLIPIYKQYKKNFMYYITGLFLVLWPLLISVKQTEFCMRSSIPALLMLCLFVIKFLFRKYNFKRHKIRYLFLCLCLLLGSATPIVEYTRSVVSVIERGVVFASADGLGSLEDNISYDEYGRVRNSNFVAEFPKEKIFFKYLARK